MLPWERRLALLAVMVAALNDNDMVPEGGIDKSLESGLMRLNLN